MNFRCSVKNASNLPEQSYSAHVRSHELFLPISVAAAVLQRSQQCLRPQHDDQGHPKLFRWNEQPKVR